MILAKALVVTTLIAAVVATMAIAKPGYAITKYIGPNFSLQDFSQHVGHSGPLGITDPNAKITAQEAQLGENKAISGNDKVENILGPDLQAGHESHLGQVLGGITTTIHNILKGGSTNGLSDVLTPPIAPHPNYYTPHP
jgi:hypothetical protein